MPQRAFTGVCGGFGGKREDQLDARSITVGTGDVDQRMQVQQDLPSLFGAQVVQRLLQPGRWRHRSVQFRHQSVQLIRGGHCSLDRIW